MMIVLAMVMSASANPVSSPRKRGGGFTFEVQQFAEGLCRRLEVKAFSWSVVVGADERFESPVCQGGEICFAWNEAAHSADGVFDPALLPRCIRIAEEGLDSEPVERALPRELGSVVEGHGSAQPWRQAGEDSQQMLGDRFGGLVGRPGGD